MNKIPFHIPHLTGKEESYIQEAIAKKSFTGGGYFHERCQKQLEDLTSAKKVLLTSSCTHALEMSALLANIEPGDEVILPSFTFVSAGNAFALRGAKLVFVDINPDTMNINADRIREAITPRTKVILVMHYGGVACDMDSIMSMADRRNILVVEDAAHCICSYYKGRHLGTIGHLGTLSFHATKNIHCGEGGALLINRDNLLERAEIIREKGTDRNRFMRELVDKYSWVDIGSSYLMSDMTAAFLSAQLDDVKKVVRAYKKIWKSYYTRLSTKTDIEVSFHSSAIDHSNGHVFFIKCRDVHHRQTIIDKLKAEGISAYFHYVPLHSATAGRKYGTFHGEDRYTTLESERLLRLPMYSSFNEVDRVASLF